MFKRILMPGALCAVLFAAAPSGAVQNLESCEKDLSFTPYHLDDSTTVHLDWSQILVRGVLFSYKPNEKMETGWAVTDTFVLEKVSPDPDLYIHDLSRGDRIFLLDRDGKVGLSGHFGLIEGEGPALYTDAGLSRVLLSPANFIRLFRQRQPAIVVRRLTGGGKAALRSRLDPWLERFRAHQRKPERLVPVGANRSYELAHFQTLFQGRLKKSEIAVPRLGYDVSTQTLINLPPVPAVTISLILPDGSEIIPRHGDHLFLLDADGNVFFEGPTPGQFKGENGLGLIGRARSAAIVRSNPDLL
jgi:hypothetical protein